VAIDVYPLAQAGCFPRLHHAPHLLVLAGYDEAEGTVRLVDPSPWQPGEMEVTRALFAACWDTAPLATDPAATPRYAWQWVRPAERGAISAGLLLERMRCNAQAMATTRGADDFIRGLAGIEALAGDVACWHDRPAAALGPLLARCYRALLEIALLREGHAGFLRSASDRCCLPGAGVLAEGFERLSEGWSVARNLLWRAGRDDPRQVLPRAASRLADLAARERTLLDRLCACLPGVPG
jgi:hypothetical protein